MNPLTQFKKSPVLPLLIALALATGASGCHPGCGTLTPDIGSRC